MDTTGVPQKINRHIMKALVQNAREGLKFGELIEYVRLCNRNLKPVANLTQVVHKSLENFQRIGLILRDDKHCYKLVAFAISKPSEACGATSRRMRTESSSSTAQKRSFASDSQKRHSDESIHGVDAETARKRLKSQNHVGNRDRKTKNLPRNKRQFIGRLYFQSNSPLFGENTLSKINYDDESLLREPGDDDRDSGDDLCVKEDFGQNGTKAGDPEQNNNPNESTSLEHGPDKSKEPTNET